MPKTPIDSEKLEKVFQTGGIDVVAKAINAVLEELHGSVWNWLRKKFPELQADEIDDGFQEGSIKAMQRCKEFDARRASFPTWFSKICWCECRTIRTRRSRQQKRQTKLPVESIEGKDKAELGCVDRESFRVRLREILVRAKEKLSERNRTIIEHDFRDVFQRVGHSAASLEKRGTDELAKLLRVNNGAARKARQRAKPEFRKAIIEVGGNEIVNQIREYLE